MTQFVSQERFALVGMEKVKVWALVKQDVLPSDYVINMNRCRSKYWRLGRGAGQNIIPAPADTGKVIGEIIPMFKGLDWFTH